MNDRDRGVISDTLTLPSVISTSHRDTVPGLLAKKAAEFAATPAIVGLGRPPLSYGDLWHHVESTIAALRSAGIGPRDRVAIVLPNGPEMATAFLAVACAAVTAPLNPSYRAAELDFFLGDLDTRALIVPAGRQSDAADVARRRDIQVLELWPDPEGPAGRFSLDCPGSTQPVPEPPAESDDIALMLHTSGTTARPKLVPLTHGNVCRSARHTRTSLQLTAADRCLNVMPLFHIHGLIGALLSSLTAGAAVVCTPGFDAGLFFDWLETFQPTWYTAVPTMHNAVLAGAMDRPRPLTTNLRLIRSASAALPAPLFAGLGAAFAVPVLEAYGMTEAAHQIASNPLPPASRKVASVGLAAGPEVAVLDEEGHLRAAGEVGEIVLRGANVTAGYLAAPAVNADAFRNGWFRTGDQGYIDQDGYIFLTGRLKELINRGGEKISPREVDDVLLAFAPLAQAVTFAIPHPTLGEDVAAAVVLRPGASATARQVRSYAAAHLAEFKVPRRVLILDELKKGPTGKLQRIGLAKELGLDGGEDIPAKGKTPGATPRTPIESRVHDAWVHVLQLPAIGIHDDFFELGGESLQAAQLIAEIQRAFGRRVALRDLFDTASTIAGMSNLVGNDDANHAAEPPMAMAGLSDALVMTYQDTATGAVLQSFPTSFEQLRLWFVQQLEPENRAYNVCRAARVKGPLEVPVLERAVRELAARHEALRTSFALVDGDVRQVVHSSPGALFSVLELAPRPGEERDNAVRRTMDEQARLPFDLTAQPLLRMRLLVLGPQEHVLLLVMHHSVCDDWSMGVLTRELATLYQAFVNNLPSPLPALPVHYRDVAAWQRQRLADGLLEEDLAFWTGQLAGLTSIDLPVARRRPARRSFLGDTYTFTLPEPLYRQLKTQALDQNCTPFMVLLAAFQLLLCRYTRKPDVAVGTPVANRGSSDLESVVGLFVNIIVLRTDLSGNPTFGELLQRVRSVALDAYTHQAAPFDQIVRALHPDRDLSRPQLAPIVFSLEATPPSDVTLPGLNAQPLLMSPHAVEVDLAITLREDAGGLSGVVEYSTELFDRETVARLVGHFATVLATVAAEPRQHISQVTLLTEAESRQLLDEWNQTAVQLPQYRGVHRLFEDQVSRSPEAIAVACNGDRLSYRELDRRSSQLAHYLQGLGVGRETLVGVCIERSVEMLIGILGILKAGGAYVPLDPAYPAERLAFMLADAGTSVLLTQERLVAELPPSDAHVICLDSHWQKVALEPETRLEEHAGAADLAYVIYTSGSTGKPKGVEVQGGALVNVLQDFTRTVGMTERDTQLAVATLSFDTATLDLLAPLTVGATVVIATHGQVVDTIALAQLLDHSGATIMVATPSLWRMLVDSGWEGDGSIVACSGGEELPADLAQSLLERAGSVWNLYGPTETAIYSTRYQVHDAGETVPLGRGVANTTLYVLDGAKQPVPIGVPGELYIGGAGVARGYLHAAALTAERFIPDSFGPAGGRLYRTGDLARYRPDGNLEFLGRADNQVKIRGYRIELGEIETALRAQPSLLDAVVATRDTGSGERRLIAYVVPRPDSPFDSMDLQAALRRTLPASMIPSLVVPLSALPMTPNRKVDRRALPDPDLKLLHAEQPIPPRTPSEATLATIWADILDIQDIGINDDFFTLGGHSLLAMRLVVRIRTAFGLEIPLRTLFDEPTLRALARYIDLATWTVAQSQADDFGKGAEREEFSL